MSDVLLSIDEVSLIRDSRASTIYLLSRKDSFGKKKESIIKSVRHE